MDWLPKYKSVALTEQKEGKLLFSIEILTFVLISLSFPVSYYGPVVGIMKLQSLWPTLES